MFLHAQDLYQKLYLGDRRLEQRLYQLTNTLLAHPEQSLPQALKSPSQLQAAYRFMDHQHVDPTHLIHSQAQGTLSRIQQHSKILIVQDTSEVEYSTHTSKKGFGHGDGSPIALKFHTALALSAQGLPLGLLHQQCWAREHEKGKAQSRRQKPVEEKESFKWLNAAQNVEKHLESAGFQGEALIISDRESDVWEYLNQKRGAGVDVLVRHAHFRRLHDSPLKIHQWLPEQDIAGFHAFHLPRADDRPAREVKASVRFARVQYQVPANKKRPSGVKQGRPRKDQAKVHFEQPFVECSVILLQEIIPPGSKVKSPIEWWLCTTKPIHSLQDALEMIEAYRLRWLIERLHYILKSGLGIENVQFEQADGVKRMLTVLSGVAFAVLHMTYLARLQPERPCEVPEVYWRTARQLNVQLERKGLEASRPNNRDFVRWVGFLGGFLGRKGDGEPGVKVLWRGWQYLEAVVQGVLLSQEQQKP